MERKLIVYSLPIFAIAIAIDFLLDHFKKTKRYHLSDSITSLSAGFFGTGVGLLTLGFVAFFYNGFYNLYHFFEIKNNFLNWILAALVYDFFYYWFHRAHHRINIFWSIHATHHNSEYFNFSTALRQSAFGFLTLWPFFLPMATIGFTYEQYLFGAGLSTLYGFFTHTEFFKYIPYFESIFVGPATHRVHHGTNPRYIDKNYGSILVIWDRIFGTFTHEDAPEKIQFGTLTPLNSFNPFWANFSVFCTIAVDAFYTRSWLDKLTIWFQETGWKPMDRRSLKQEKIPNFAAQKLTYDLKELAYVLFNFGLATLGTIHVMAVAKLHSKTWVWVYLFAVWLILFSNCLFLERRKIRYKFEILRLVFTAVVLVVGVLQ